MSLTPEQHHYLIQQGVPTGMAQALARHQHNPSPSFWMLDNGGAMLVRDAHLVREQHYQHNVPGVTRWEELGDCVAYHADWAARFQWPTRYALLNPPQQQQQQQQRGGNLPQYWSIHQSGNLPLEQQILRRVMQETVPAGPTPLTAQFKILREHLMAMAPQWIAQRQTVTIVVATQGCPTNERGESSPATVQEFVQVLRSLETLPVGGVVLRMCTDDERAFDFYNRLDAQIQLPLDVL